jgi:hypothetical protein
MQNRRRQATKQSGMVWSETGAKCVLNFRTLLLSERSDAFWGDFQNGSSARNDVLAPLNRLKPTFLSCTLKWTPKFGQ